MKTIYQILSNKNEHIIENMVASGLVVLEFQISTRTDNFFRFKSVLGESQPNVIYFYVPFEDYREPEDLKLIYGFINQNLPQTQLIFTNGIDKM